jgi:hypothetical protein
MSKRTVFENVCDRLAENSGLINKLDEAFKLEDNHPAIIVDINCMLDTLLKKYREVDEILQQPAFKTWVLELLARYNDDHVLVEELQKL